MKKLKETLKYIAGTFLIQANDAFLNGGSAGGAGEDQNLVMPKSMWANGKQVPYVSSQAWKHWLRDTLIQETGWKASILRAVKWNTKGNTSKIAGMLNPVDYPEDDIFGYMFTLKKERGEKAADELTDEQKTIVKDLPTVQLVRPAIFLASLLSAIQTKATISKDEAYVHLKDQSTPLPYTTGFYNADLNSIFGMDIARLGVFNNETAPEIDPRLAESGLSNGKLEQPDADHAIYQKADLENYRKDVICQLFNALVHLQGGAKMAQFGVDVTPKVIVAAGLNIKTPIFSNLFAMGQDKPILHVGLLKELMNDYAGRIQTPVFIGLRKDYLENEGDIQALGDELGDKVILGTPIEIAQKIGENL